MYCHQRKDTGKCFYIGKGKGNRAYSKSNRNPHWHNIVNKVGYDVVILVNGITEEKALELEIDFIAQIGLENLCNITIGGEGVSGLKHSDKSRKMMSDAKTGKNHPRYGKPSDKHPLYGRIGDKNPTSKPILQIDKDTNQIICEFSCAYEAERTLKISQSNITACCIGKRKSAGNFIWKYTAN